MNFNLINNIENWLNSALEWLNNIWIWMTPGAHAVAKVAPIGVPLVALFAAIYAVRTFRLRARVDHAEHWLKRFHEGVEKSLSTDEIEQQYGTELLSTLRSPERPWLFFDSEKEYNLRLKQISAIFGRMSDWVNWKIGWIKTPFRYVSWILKWVIFGHSIKILRTSFKYHRKIFVEESKKRKVIKSRARKAFESRIPAPSLQLKGSTTPPPLVSTHPTFKERLIEHRKYRKLRKVRWVVSPEEVDAHKTISDLLRARIIGSDIEDPPATKKLLLPKDK